MGAGGGEGGIGAVGGQPLLDVAGEEGRVCRGEERHGCHQDGGCSAVGLRKREVLRSPTTGRLLNRPGPASAAASPCRGQIRFLKKGPQRCQVKLTISYEVPSAMAPFASVSGGQRAEGGRGRDGEAMHEACLHPKLAYSSTA